MLSDFFFQVKKSSSKIEQGTNFQIFLYFPHFDERKLNARNKKGLVICACPERRVLSNEDIIVTGIQRLTWNCRHQVTGQRTVTWKDQ